MAATAASFQTGPVPPEAPGAGASSSPTRRIHAALCSRAASRFGLMRAGYGR